MPAMMSKRPGSRPAVVGMLVGVVVVLGAGCGGSSSESSQTQTGKVVALQVGGISLNQLANGTVTTPPTVLGVTITTTDGKKVAASVPASLATSLGVRNGQTVVIKKVSGKWQVTKLATQP